MAVPSSSCRRDQEKTPMASLIDFRGEYGRSFDHSGWSQDSSSKTYRCGNGNRQHRKWRSHPRLAEGTRRRRQWLVLLTFEASMGVLLIILDGPRTAAAKPTAAGTVIDNTENGGPILVLPKGPGEDANG